MIRRTFLATALAFAATGARADAAQIEAVIGAQLEAFKADDFAEAFSYASPMIQTMFGTWQRFGSMVRNGYPMVWRPAEVRFLELEDRGGSLYQRVRIRDAQGGSHLLEYQMIRNQAGWRINGVQILRDTSIGA
ncbi:DUF4864 domain-containing protein [Dinoroseobacter sp. PD6]|uniref:DUF4864 domain-containing protein n=1 Tax=Dinoroseobacter sp. PD6 TaxID=3028384 RepID=UPI00237A6463|nr:DUF4864 domain-containing protein [Dinoroseobacter sp. PD6]MDD9716542.1 DUF4864 domain-containing protein [Dinoroseobacter sp. PD6]